MSNTVLWRRLDIPGHEIATLDAVDDRWRLSGTAVFASPQGPCRLDYLINCDVGWATTSAQVQGIAGCRNIGLNVSVDSARKWRLNGAECPAVEHCLDIDLGFSPSTNLLPIRRLGLVVGGGAGVRAAWLPFPSLSFELLSQLYHREGERTYRYESNHGAFVRTLDVDAAGFVRKYPGLWRAESA